MNTPISVGRNILFTLPNGQVRPAQVVRVWSDNMVNLQVLVDGTNDSRGCDGPSGVTPEEGERGLAWRTSVHPSASGGPEPGHWHWPPRVA